MFFFQKEMFYVEQFFFSEKAKRKAVELRYKTPSVKTRMLGVQMKRIKSARSARFFFNHI
jgi:hypothetical protein